MRGLALCLFLLAGSAHAQDGRPDLTFHTDPAGIKALGPIGTLSCCYNAWGATIAADGSVAQARIVQEGAMQRLTLERYSRDGVLDAAFGGIGGRRALFYSLSDLAQQPDGTFLLLGETSPIRASNDPDVGPVGPRNDAVFAARFLANGRPDTTFGLRGVAIFGAHADGVSYPYAAGTQRDGRIVVGSGYFENGCNDCATLLRLLPDGSRDPTFGTGGFTRFNPTEGDDVFFDMAVLPDDRIVVAGLIGSRFGVARFTPDGKPDLTFGTGGYYRLSTYFGRAATLAVLPDGRLLVAGYTYTALPGTAIAPTVMRFLPDGVPDPTFGINGRVEVTPPDAGGNTAWGLAPLPGGDLLVSGSAYNPGTRSVDVFVARLTPTGGLNPAFGTGGRTFLDVQYGEARGYSLRLLSEGGILVLSGGNNEGGDSGSLVLARLRADGTPDPALAPTPQAWRNVPGLTTLSALLPTADGRLYVTGTQRFLAPRGASVRRLLPDGKPDPTYQQLDGQQFGFDPAGALLTPGESLVFADKRRFRAVRLHPDGRLDSSFAAGGFSLSYDPNNSPPHRDKGVAVATLPGGGYALAGQYLQRFAVGRLAPGGQRVVSFGMSGMFRPAMPDTVGIAEAVGALADGRIVAAGTIGDRLTVIRLRANGTPDASFVNAEGRFTLSDGRGAAHALLLLPGGAMVVAGMVTTDGTPRFAVLRLRADGRRDPDFGNDGVFVLPRGADTDAAYSLLLLPDGSLLAGGRWQAPDQSNGQTIVRLSAAGVLDPTFGERGIVHNTFGAATTLALLPGGRLLAGSTVLNAYTLDDAGLAPAPGVAAMLSMPRPNPARGFTWITVLASAAQPVQVDLLDVLGRSVRQLHAGSGDADVRIDTEGLPSGLYLVRARSQEGATVRPLTVVR